MIQSYLFPLSKNESKCIASIGWEFIKNQKERWVEIDLDISSIDFSFPESTRFTHENKVYSIYTSYLDCLGKGVTNRILLGKLVDTEKEILDVSGLIPEDIVEEYLTLVNEYAKLEKSYEGLKKETEEGREKLFNTIKEYNIIPSSQAPTFDSLTEDIKEVATVRYNSGYNTGMVDADNRVNTQSVNYKSGYNAGVTYADGRSNADSANYKAGYKAGYDTGYPKGVSDADGREKPGTVNWQCGVNAGIAHADGRANPNSENWKNGRATGFAECQNNLKAGYPGTNNGFRLDFAWRVAANNGIRPVATEHMRMGPAVSYGGLEFITFTWAGVLNMNGWTSMYRWYF